MVLSVMRALTFRVWGEQEGYDHSYFFIQTFVDDHVEHHAKILKA